MSKKYLCAVSLVAAMLPAQAAVQAYSWSYAGFVVALGDPRPGRLSGTFAVDDANGDGMFTTPELRSFIYDGHEYANCPEREPAPCTFRNFAYTPADDLTFRLSRYETIHDSRFGEVIETGHFWVTSAMYPEGEPNIHLQFWTDKTQFSISAIPEPQTYLLMSLALLAAIRVARRSQESRSRAPTHAGMH